jgi:cysteine-rich repeat protein
MFSRALLLLLSAAISSCSFIDDFERFRRTADAGDFDAGDFDAALPPDAGESEAGEDDAEAEGGGVDAGPGDELCAGETDGTPCGEDAQLICLKGFCRTSRCGDGFTDATHDEQCDDANLTRNDGCEPASCHFSCVAHADCDNGFACDGDELCDVRSHSCLKDEVPATNKACTQDGVPGVCNDSGYCVTPGCGDGVVAGTEECDPKTMPRTPGCRADCAQGCTSDAQCRDDDLCNGDETCQRSTGECHAGTPLPCLDDDPCTQNGQCEAATGCVFALVDGDSDQVAGRICAPGSSHQGGDCNDGNAAVYPGAIEYCDGFDNDCDGARDEGAVMAVCHPDRDRDGYPDEEGGISACNCPAGTRPPRADGQWDCWDDPQAGGNDVHPGQEAYFGDGYETPCASGNGSCTSFDYNCDGTPTPLYGAGPGACSALGAGLTCAGSGYSGAAPACGEQGSYLICEGTLLRCMGKAEPRRQVCH